MTPRRKNSYKKRLLEDIRLLLSVVYSDDKTPCVLCTIRTCEHCSLDKFRHTKYHCGQLRRLMDKHGKPFLEAMYRTIKATPREKLTPWYIKTIGVPRHIQKELKKWEFQQTLKGGK